MDNQLSPLSVATELHAIELQEAQIKVRKEQLREVLFESLKHQGVKSVKLEDGTVYLRSERHTLKPVPKYQEQAWAWAAEHNSLKIDTTRAYRILSRELKLPRCFRVHKSEYLVVRRPGAITRRIVTNNVCKHHQNPASSSSCFAGFSALWVATDFM
jgi:hypothetical protein